MQHSLEAIKKTKYFFSSSPPILLPRKVDKFKYLKISKFFPAAYVKKRRKDNINKFNGIII